MARALRAHKRHRRSGGPQVGSARCALTSVISRVEALRLICKKCLVAGRVQGVFYRGTAARRAQELAIRGYARNLADGRGGSARVRRGGSGADICELALDRIHRLESYLGRSD